MPFPAPKFEKATKREAAQKGNHTYPMGSKMKKGSKLECLGCKGKGCKGCGNKGYIVV